MRSVDGRIERQAARNALQQRGLCQSNGEPLYVCCPAVCTLRNSGVLLPMLKTAMSLMVTVAAFTPAGLLPPGSVMLNWAWPPTLTASVVRLAKGATAHDRAVENLVSGRIDLSGR